MGCIVTSLTCFFFFFQAEDGIRDVAVTGVQTCALPISTSPKVAPAASSVFLIPSILVRVCASRLSGSLAKSSRRCGRSEEHTSELQSRLHLVCRLLLEKKKKTRNSSTY